MIKAHMFWLHFCPCLLGAYNVGAKEYVVFMGYIVGF